MVEHYAGSMLEAADEMADLVHAEVDQRSGPRRTHTLAAVNCR
jgi:hypothetical protein